MKPEMEAVAACLKTAGRVAVTSHLSPDGDGLGSGLALVLALRALGKDSRFVSFDGVPRRYRFLPGADGVEQSESLTGNWDAVVLMECPDPQRCGLSGLDGYPLVNIDHHSINALFGSVNWVDPSAAAVGEMVFDLLPGLGAELDADIATNLYTALVSDTPCFFMLISSLFSE